ncbi:MAG: putative lipoprotein [Saprospiraceae bacterium]|jgi:predicted lipoprotein
MNYNFNGLKCISNAKLLLLLVVGAFMVSNCTSEEGPMTGVDPDPEVLLSELRQEIAIQLADHHILPSYDKLSIASQDLLTAVQNVNSAVNVESLNSLKMGLQRTWLVWQQASIYQMGPTETNALRGALNTYPSDKVKIELNISNGSWVIGALDNKAAVGFPAIDYLVNSESETEVVNALTEDPARLAYLTELIHALDTKIQKVVSEWETGSFITNYKSTTANGTDVGSALGMLVNSIDLHFQRFLRDGKVAIPAGVRSAGVSRPLAIEALYGGYSRELLKESIQAYSNLIQGFGVDGNNGKSIAAYLVALDQKQIGDDMLASLSTSLSIIESMDADLGIQIDLDNDKMIETFMELQTFVTLVKSDMSSVMGITITNQDTDGD